MNKMRVKQEEHSKGKKKKKMMDYVQLTSKPPTPAPLNVDYVFFHPCFIVLFQYLDIFFTLKVKKICEKWIRTKTPPPPIVDLIHQNVVFFVFVFF